MAGEMNNQTGGNNWWQGQQQQQAPQAPSNPWGGGQQQQAPQAPKQQSPTSGYGSFGGGPTAPAQPPVQPPAQPPLADTTGGAAGGGGQPGNQGFNINSSMSQLLQQQQAVNLRAQAAQQQPDRGFRNYAGAGGSMMGHIKGQANAKKMAADKQQLNQQKYAEAQAKMQNALMNLKGNYGSLEEMQTAFGDTYNQGYVSDPTLFQSGPQRRMGSEYDSMMTLLPALWGM